MPRYNVEYNGKWACFSSVINDFITEFIDKTEYEEWRLLEYGRVIYRPAVERNCMSMEDAVVSIALNRDREETIECLTDTGIPREESEKLMYDHETKYNCPESQNDGSYVCPNCCAPVIKGQPKCEIEGCCNRLVWR